MEVIKTNIKGVVIIEPRLLKDDRDISSNRSRKGSLTKRYVPSSLYRIMKYVLVWSDEGAAFSNYALQSK